MKRFTFIIVLLFVFLSSYAKQPHECNLSLTPYQCKIQYPNSYGLNTAQDFKVVSFNKKYKAGIAYNDYCIVEFYATEEQTKLIKQCGIKDLQQKDLIEYKNQIYTVKNNIYNTAYTKYRTDSISLRESFVKDSLDVRLSFVNDSIKNYQAYVSDSLKEREEYVTLTLTVDSMRKEFESKKVIKAKRDKEFWASKGSPVALNMVWWSSNSVGGITAKFEVLNLSKKTIKYVAITGYFKNAVGDRVYNQVGRGSSYTVRGIGPIGPAPTSFDEFAMFADATGTYEFDDCFFYSRTADKIEVSSVKLTYTDGTTQTVSGKVLDKQMYWKEDDLIDAVYGYKNYIEYVKSFNKLEALLSKDIEYTPKVYEPIEYSPITYKPIKFDYKNYK